jgi:hypothetical protein
MVAQEVWTEEPMPLEQVRRLGGDGLDLKAWDEHRFPGGLVVRGAPMPITSAAGHDSALPTAKTAIPLMLGPRSPPQRLVPPHALRPQYSAASIGPARCDDVKLCAGAYISNRSNA